MKKQQSGVKNTSEMKRPIPANPSYALSESGRMYGPNGRQCCPDVARKSLARSARYQFWAVNKKIRISVKELMREVWDVEFIPTPNWVDAVKKEWSDAKLARKKYMAEQKAKNSAKKILDQRPCLICYAYFQPTNGNQRICQKDFCQKEKERRRKGNIRKGEKAKKAVEDKPEAPPVDVTKLATPGTDFYSMETGCPEYRSWDCPEMDPLTTRHRATVTEVWALYEPKRRGRKAA